MPLLPAPGIPNAQTRWKKHHERAMLLSYLMFIINLIINISCLVGGQSNAFRLSDLSDLGRLLDQAAQPRT
jgi:hypothetical protein